MKYCKKAYIICNMLVLLLNICYNEMPYCVYCYYHMQFIITVQVRRLYNQNILAKVKKLILSKKSQLHLYFKERKLACTNQYFKK